MFDLQQNILKWFLKFFPILLPFSDVWGDCWLREGQNLHINISQKVWAPDDGVVPADLSHWQEAWKAKWHCWWFLFLLKLRTSFLSQSRINWRAGRGKAKMSSLYWYPGLSALETLNLLVLCWPMIVTICVSGQPLRPTSTSGWRSIPTTYHDTTGSSSTVTKPKQRRKGTASHISKMVQNCWRYLRLIRYWLDLLCPVLLFTISRTLLLCKTAHLLAIRKRHERTYFKTELLSQLSFLIWHLFVSRWAI